ncbi:MAG: acyl-CoA dehydrogenase family protein, partial [Emcibacter sp.]|nr:acyl-CoA dehydrogenase family protein [Emcibacter sp.]
MTNSKCVETDNFRTEVRRWLAENFPTSLKGKNPLTFQTHPEIAQGNADYKNWCARINMQKWGQPTWPEQYGGGDLSTEQAAILQEEMIQIGAFNPVVGNGPMMLGPTLLEYGTEILFFC